MRHISYLFVTLFLFTSIITYSQEFPTRGEIYDYEVGDIFHMRESGDYYAGGYVATVNSEVMDKYYSALGDTVFYTQFFRRLESGSANPDPTITEFVENEFYTDLDDIIMGNSVSENPNVYNGRKTVLNEYGSGYAVHEDRYTVGCGHTYYRYDYNHPDEYSEHSIWLVYFKKGDEEWGEEQIIIGIDDNMLHTDINLYPNPTTNILNVTNVENTRLGIYNATGQLLLSQELNSSNSQIDVSILPTGVYLVNIVDEKGLVKGKTKFIKSTNN